MSAWLVVAYASGYFDGHCGTTVSLSPNDQERGSCMGVLGSFKLPNNLALGSWDERGADAASFCVDRCNACGPTACQFVSISLQYSDCSYYAACNLAALRTFPEGFRTLNVSDSKSTIHQLQHLPARQQSGRRACDWVTAGLRGVDAAAQTNITSTWSMCLYSGTLDSSGEEARLFRVWARQVHAATAPRRLIPPRRDTCRHRGERWHVHSCRRGSRPHGACV